MSEELFDGFHKKYMECLDEITREKLGLAFKTLESSPEATFGGFDPPPWNTYEHPEKTDGWIAYQQYLREKHG